MKQIWSFLFTLPLSTIATLAPITIAVAQQQVSSDGTVSTTVTTPDGRNFNINDGTIRGTNLFHSFKEFSVPNGGSANFNNAANIQNIISRVTGGSISTIDGLIKANGAANLFLLNPAGIIFGPNASLQIGGSFLGSTANSFLFDNGFEFSATDPQAPPLLTINVPIGLGFRNNPQNITTQSTTTQYPTLEVPSGKTITLVGGNVSLDGPYLFAPGGRVELGGLSTAGTVGLNGDGSLSFPVGVQRADVSLTKEAFVDVRAGGGGSIAVNARNLDISGGSNLYAGIRQNSGSVGSQAGNIDIDATGSVKISGSDIYNFVPFGATGSSGNINIKAESVSLTDGFVLASNAGQGNAGNITLQAQDTVSLNNSLMTSNIGSPRRQPAKGKVGNIVIDAKDVSLSNGSELQAGLYSNAEGDPGVVSVRAKESVSLTGSGIFNNVESDAVGNGSDIQISAKSVSLSDGAVLQTSNAGQGNAGNITLQAKDTVSLRGRSFILSNIGSPQRQPAKGKVGNIQIEARAVSLTETSQMQAGLYSNAEGNPGIVSIKATDSVSFAGTDTGIFTNVEPGAVGDGSKIQISTGLPGSVSLIDGAVLTASNGGRGNGGDITIDTGSFSNKNGSVVSTSTYGVDNGKAGNLFIKANELVEVIGTGTPGEGTSLRANVESEGTGKGGDLTIETKKLVVRNAQVGTSLFGKGEGGNLTVRATDSVELSGKVFSTNPNNPNEPIRNPAGLFSQINSEGEGKGGNLTIETNRLSVGDGAKVQVATFGKGDAGNLLIRASDIDVYETANANFFPGGIFAGVQVDEDETTVPPKGYGGSVTIETDRLRVRDGARVSTSTEGDGDAGTLVIRAKESVEVSGKLLNPNGRFYNDTSESQISAAATSTSTGNGGSVSIETPKLIVRDSGTVTVRSDNTKPAGNLEINARSIKLDNQGSLTATTQSGNGGNIILGVQDFLLLRRNSNISTSAGLAGAGGDGGNITINSPLIVAFPSENSDITANAFNGSGGKVTINTQGLFGITPLSRQELEQRLNTTDPTQLDPKNLPTNDITAISQNNPNLSGTVNIITPDVDPSRGLFELSETVIDPAQQIAQNPCTKGFGSSFTIIGRGGIPTDPKKILSSDNVRVDLVKPSTTTNSITVTVDEASKNPTVKRIIPAQGWIYNEKGEVLLVGYDPTKTGPQRQQQTPASSCAAVR
ncbi:filamentous hemagglutinin N-terminal domain-containing protein [Scytonema tolypothrichoides VB-61278]|nr:filamentous hemagglutinin N-terminal domain-containing protein [Scytonema tolypothrichoides VB-61278]